MGLLLARRLIIAGYIAAVVTAFWLRSLGDDPKFHLKLVGVFSITLFVACLYAVTRIDRKLQRATDEWRRARRLERTPELVAAERAARAPHAPMREVVTASTGSHIEHAPRNHPLSAGRARLKKWLERLFVVHLLLGLPFLAWLVGGAAIVAYPALVFIALVVSEFLVPWTNSSEGVPGAAEARRERRERIDRSRGWWSVTPPRTLTYLRLAFVALVVAGFAALLLLPYLQGQTPPERYRSARMFVIGFLIALTVLAFAERKQALREKKWLQARQAQRDQH